MTHPDQNIETAHKERILVLDGAMGTEIQALKRESADFQLSVWRDVRRGVAVATASPIFLASA